VSKHVRIYWPMQDQYYDGMITRYNRTKRRHRVEYQDGDHEWINLGAEKNRVQLYNGQAWVEYDQYETPELLAKREAARDLKMRQRVTKEIFDERRSWMPLAPIERDDAVLVRWVHKDTGEMKIGHEDFDKWEEGTDRDGVLYWRHAETGTTVAAPEDDPRWDTSGGDPRAQAKRRMAILQDVRYYCYIIRGLLERYIEEQEKYTAVANAVEHGGDPKTLPNAERDLREALDALRGNQSIKGLQATVAAAREEYTENEYQKNEELVYASQLLEQAQQVEKFALQRQWEREQSRRQMVDAAHANRKSATITCRYCQHEIPRTSNLCPSCGKKVVALD